MAWLGLLMSAGIVAAITLPLVNDQRSLPADYYFIFMLLLAVPISLFFVARGIFARREWARWAGMIYGFLTLFGIPIGTIIGGYVLWQLKKGWPAQ